MNVFSRDRFTDEGGLRARITGMPGWARWGIPAVAVVFLAFLCWLGFQAWNVKSHLEQARNYAQQSKDALLAGKTEDATRWAENGQFNARQAQAAAHSLPFSVAAAVPVLGSPVKTTQQISDVVVGLATDVLIPATKVGVGVSPDKLVEGTRINFNLLRQEQPQLSELAAAAAKLDAQSQAIARSAYLSVIGNARSQLQDQTAKLASLLSNSAIAAQLAPSMLGADGPRTYLLAFQNNAEARGTGGILGGFGIIRFEDGRPTVNSLAANTELDQAVAAVDLGPDFNRVYGWTNPYGDFKNSNLSPHFPYAAQIWKSMWEQQSGLPVDGVIAVDPVVLSYLLGAIGPVKLQDGELINRDNVVELTQSTAYSRFIPVARAPEGMSAVEAERYDKYYAAALRKKYLLDIAQAVAQKISGPLPAPRLLLDAFGRAASEGRISVWSASPPEQKLLEETPLAHSVPDTNTPYAQVVINNLAGNKMDYYLTREIEYVADKCQGDMRNATVTVRLNNTASPDKPLPEYVGKASGLADGLRLQVPDGTMVTSVRVITTKGATLMSVTSNGERTSAIRNTENGHPSFEVQVAIPPGKSGELSFRISEPTSPGLPQLPVQPLIDNPSTVVDVPTCS